MLQFREVECHQPPFEGQFYHLTGPAEVGSFTPKKLLFFCNLDTLNLSANVIRHNEGLIWFIIGIDYKQK
jgi:hypothetical protein